VQIGARRAAAVQAAAQEHRDPSIAERPAPDVRLRERFGFQPGGKPIHPEIEFLRRYGVAARLLSDATWRAERHGTDVRLELFAGGLDRNLYWSALAADLSVPFIEDLSGFALIEHADLIGIEAVRCPAAALVSTGRDVRLVVAPTATDITLLRKRLRTTPALANRIAITPPETIRALLALKVRSALRAHAASRLASKLPMLSSRKRVGSGLKGLALLGAALLALILLAPAWTYSVAGLACSLFFVNCSAWKIAAAFRRPRTLRLEPVPDTRLPTYTILVPLYRETSVVGDLIRHLGALDYPVCKLQILLLLEADDASTRAAVMRRANGAPFEVLIIPPGGPRTKPNALTYALPFARGDIVVVFDAEDRPEADQLRKAAAAFRERPHLGCVQARLAPDNFDSWLARMFTLEYAANFEVLLPALASWRLPVPLGGTSNHFPRAVLERVGAWDPATSRKTPTLVSGSPASVIRRRRSSRVRMRKPRSRYGNGCRSVGAGSKAGCRPRRSVSAGEYRGASASRLGRGWPCMAC
jgi:hypothetical protein